MAQNSRTAAGRQPNDPYIGAVAITGAAQTFDPTARGILCGVAGNVNVTFIDGSSATLPMNAGTVYPLCIKAITAAGTTITGSFALL